MWELEGPIMLGPSTSKTLIKDISGPPGLSGPGAGDELLVDGLHDHADGVVTGDVAGGAEGVLGDVQRHHDGADGTVGVAGLRAEDHVQEGQGGHNGAAGGAGGGDHGNAQGHDKGDDDAQADRQAVHQAHGGGAGGDGDHGAGHVDVGAQGHHEVADLLGDAVLGGALQVHRDGGGGGLGADGGGVAGNLVADELDGVLVADGTGDDELDADADQVHQDDHQEHLPQHAEDGEGLSGLGHVYKGAADVEGQQGDDHGVEDLVDDAGEVLHALIEGIADGLAPQHGQAQPQHKGEHHGGQGVQQGRDGDGEVAVQGHAGGGGDLFHGPFAHKVGKEAGGDQVGG